MKLEKKIKLLLGIFIGGLCACVLGMFYLTVFQNEKYSGDEKMYTVYSTDSFLRLSREQQANCVVEDQLKPMRGVIYDEKSRPLVSDVRVYPIGIDGKNFNENDKIFPNPKTSPYLDTLIMDLSRAFYRQFHNRYPNITVEKYKAKFEQAFKERKRVQIFTEENVCKRNKMVFDKDIAIIRQLPVLSGTIAPKDCPRYGLDSTKNYRFSFILDKGSRHLTVRLHPYGDLAGRILGSMENKNGIDGCDTFNTILAGTPGIRRTLHVNGIAVPLEVDNPLVSGGDIYTTLNVDIQKIVHKEVTAKAKQLHAKWGCAIVMETATGDIKAICNLGIDTVNGTLTYREDRNYAMLPSSAEPGSTFKLASMLAYLEQMKGDTTRRYSVFHHTFTFRGKRYTQHDSHSKNHDEKTNASIKEVFQRSSNVGIAMMMQDAFPSYKDYVRKIDSLYITISCNAQIGQVGPLAIASMLPNSRYFTDQYAHYFGASFTMTPMQTLLYYNAVANDGTMVQPRFVSKASIGGKEIEYPTKVINKQIASAKTIAIAKQFLHAVAAEEPGTAYARSKLYAPNVDIAGKTGTRDVYRKGKGYDQGGNCISFCGYFPANAPQYTCIVYLFDVGQAGSGEAVEVFAKIASQIMAQPQNFKESQRHLSFRHPILSQELACVAESWSVHLTRPTSDGYWISKKETPTTVIPYKLPMNGKIPVVTGLSAADAVCELRNRGCNVQMSGYGIVKSQSYNPANNTVMLTLSPG